MATRPAPVIWVCFAMLVGMMSTALISPLYALYQSEWSLKVSDISLTYVIYMLGALLSLLMLGRLPDKLGYAKLLALSIALTFLGTLLTLLAKGLPLLFLGRFLVGVASSICTSAGAAALDDHLPARFRPRQSLIFSLMIAFSFGLGPLLGGLIGQFAPSPLITAYVPTLILGVISFVTVLAFVRETKPKSAVALTWADFTPKLTSPEFGKRAAFFVACGSVFLAFSVFGLYASMVPLFVQNMMHIQGPVVSGVSIAAILMISAVTQISSQRIAPQTGLLIGLVGLALCNLALMINITLNSSWLFMLGVLLTAVGHGTSMLSSMSMVSRVATPNNRSGLTSTYMVIGYFGAIGSSLGLGYGANIFGIIPTVQSFCGVIVMLSAVLFGANLWTRRC